MKKQHSNRNILLGISVCIILAFTAMAFQDSSKVNNSNQQAKADTVPKNNNIDINIDLKDVDQSIKKSLEMVEKSLKEIDMNKIKMQVEESMKQIDLAKMQLEIEKSMKAIDWNKMKSDIDKSMKEIDMAKLKFDLDKMNAEIKLSLKEINTEEMKKSLEEVKKINFDELKKEMEKLKIEMELNKDHFKIDMDKFKMDMGKFKNELNEIKKKATLLNINTRNYLLTERNNRTKPQKNTANILKEIILNLTLKEIKNWDTLSLFYCHHIRYKNPSALH